MEDKGNNETILFSALCLSLKVLGSLTNQERIQRRKNKEPICGPDLCVYVYFLLIPASGSCFTDTLPSCVIKYGAMRFDRCSLFKLQTLQEVKLTGRSLSYKVPLKGSLMKLYKGFLNMFVVTTVKNMMEHPKAQCLKKTHLHHL